MAGQSPTGTFGRHRRFSPAEPFWVELAWGTAKPPEKKALPDQDLRVEGVGFRVWGFGFGVWGLGFRV